MELKVQKDILTDLYKDSKKWYYTVLVTEDGVLVSQGYTIYKIKNPLIDVKKLQNSDMLKGLWTFNDDEAEEVTDVYEKELSAGGSKFKAVVLNEKVYVNKNFVKHFKSVTFKIINPNDKKKRVVAVYDKTGEKVGVVMPMQI